MHAILIHDQVIAALLVGIDGAFISPLGPLTILASILLTRSLAILSEQHTPQRQQVLEFLVIADAIMACIYILRLPLSMPKLAGDNVCAPFEPPTSMLRSPEENLTVWQFMSVSWMAPLIAIGSVRQLQDEDIWDLAYEFQHAILHIHFRELPGTVVQRLFGANGVDLIITTFLAILESLASKRRWFLIQRGSLIGSRLLCSRPATVALAIYGRSRSVAPRLRHLCFAITCGTVHRQSVRCL